MSFISFDTRSSRSTRNTLITRRAISAEAFVIIDTGMWPIATNERSNQFQPLAKNSLMLFAAMKRATISSEHPEYRLLHHRYRWATHSGLHANKYRVNNDYCRYSELKHSALGHRTTKRFKLFIHSCFSCLCCFNSLWCIFTLVKELLAKNEYQLFLHSGLYSP